MRRVERRLEPAKVATYSRRIDSPSSGDELFNWRSCSWISSIISSRSSVSGAGVSLSDRSTDREGCAVWARRWRAKTAGTGGELLRLASKDGGLSLEVGGGERRTLPALRNGLSTRRFADGDAITGGSASASCAPKSTRK